MMDFSPPRTIQNISSLSLNQLAPKKHFVVEDVFGLHQEDGHHATGAADVLDVMVAKTEVGTATSQVKGGLECSMMFQIFFV